MKQIKIVRVMQMAQGVSASEKGNAELGISALNMESKLQCKSIVAFFVGGRK
jgi:hypothetical protein